MTLADSYIRVYITAHVKNAAIFVSKQVNSPCSEQPCFNLTICRN